MKFLRDKRVAWAVILSGFLLSLPCLLEGPASAWAAPAKTAGAASKPAAAVAAKPAPTAPAAPAAPAALAAPAAPAVAHAEPGPGRITRGDAVILGVVEGLTEYLPVSSTGHLILAADWLGLSSGSQMKSEAVDAFDIVIQLGAILAVVGLYRRRVGQMALGVVGKDRDGLRLFILLIVAFIPAAIVGLPLHKWIKAELFHPLPVVGALAAGGVLMIVVEQLWKRRKTPLIKGVENIRLEHAMIIGLAQILSMWPGTSRSMITILAGLIVGLDMVTAAEFSFLLALPTLGAATLYEGFKSRHVLAQVAGVDGCLIGLVVSGIVAALAVKMFVRYLTSHGLMPFGVYRILAAGAVYLSLK